MENDITKLKNLISTLEEEIDTVGEFNGVLSEVEKARNEIVTSKELFERISEGYEKYAQQLLENTHMFNSLNKAITSQRTLTPEEFEAKNKASIDQINEHLDDIQMQLELTHQANRDSLIKLLEGQSGLINNISSLKYLTPEQFETGIKKYTEIVAKQVNDLEKELDIVSQSNREYMKKIVSLGVVAGVGLIVIVQILFSHYLM